MALSEPTAAQVRAVISTQLTDEQVDSIIADAVLIAEGCAAVEGYSSARQAAIVKWLAAHLIASTNDGGGALSQKSLGDASESYARPQLGVALSGTPYGQQALALETSGCLARLGAKRSFVEVL